MNNNSAKSEDTNQGYSKEDKSLHSNGVRHADPTTSKWLENKLEFLILSV